LEEYADALFQTLRVKPYQLAESAVSDAVIAQAISPEVLERMKALNDPAVQQVLADFKANVQKAVQQSGEMLQNGVGDNIGNLLGDIGRKLSKAIQLLIADIPGWGVFMSALDAGDAAVQAVKQVEVIEGEVVQALKPLYAIQNQVGKVTAAVDAATGAATGLASGLATSATVKGAEGDVEMTELGPKPESGEAESGNVSGKGAELEMQPMGESAATQSAATQSAATQSAATQSKEEESAPALGNRTTPARQVGPQDDTFATPLSKNKKENDDREKDENRELGGGGSRKRRRIHKLSRRIERTLRRVQKKYGLQSNQGNQGNQGNQYKNGFLRRTLRHRKP
jgi:hypothetical protein